MASAVTDLPLPDSPTSATVRVAAGCRTTCPSPPRTCRRSSGSDRRSRTLTSGSRVHACHASAPLQLRIERVAQRVGEQAEGGDQHRHRAPSRRRAATTCRGSARSAPRSAWCPTTRRRRGTPKPRKRQDHLGLDEQHDVQVDSCTSTTWLTFGKMCDEHAARVRRADRVGGLHVFARLVLQVFGADQPEDAGPAGEPEDQDRSVSDALLLQHRGDREDQQQIGDRA